VGPTFPPDPSTSPPTVITDDPTQTPPPDPTQGGRRTDIPSLIAALLRIYQTLFPPGGSRIPGVNVNLQIPSFQLPRGQAMYVNTSLLGGGGEGGGFGGFGGLLGQGINLASQFFGPQAQPGGAPTPSLFNFDLPGIDIVGQGQGAGCSALQSPFASGGQRGSRPKIHIRPDPITGRPVWFRPAGRPLLWSSDLTAVKRVRKIASRARRARGGR
jgi:hypothetical protein